MLLSCSGEGGVPPEVVGEDAEGELHVGFFDAIIDRSAAAHEPFEDGVGAFDERADFLELVVFMALVIGQGFAFAGTRSPVLILRNDRKLKRSAASSTTRTSDRLYHCSSTRNLNIMTGS